MTELVTEPVTGSADRPMTRIDRQVRLDVAPMRVAAELTGSPWRSALRIEPAGAGTMVLISARIEPEGLARSIEALAIEEVCRLRSPASATAQPTTTARTTTTAQPTNTIRRKGNRTMTTIRKHVTIDAPVERVWPALADFGAVAVWNPNVKTSRLTSDEGTGVGITRECSLLPVGTIQERVTEWTEGRMMGIEIFDFKNVPAMRRAVAVIEVEPRDGATVATMEMTYEVGLGALGAGMNSVMMKRQFTKSVTAMLAGLKHHVETGDEVDRRSKLPIAAVAAA